MSTIARLVLLLFLALPALVHAQHAYTTNDGPATTLAADPGAKTTNWMFRSCTVCGSIQRIQTLEGDVGTLLPPGTIGKWQWQYRSRGGDTCRHDWEAGFVNSVPTKVANGEVVLVKKGDLYGAFMLHGQRARQKVHLGGAKYTWCYGTDETGKFNLANSATRHSTAPEVFDSPDGVIAFGPFEVQWSAAGRAGLGHVYYAAVPGRPLGKEVLGICVTATNSFAGIRPSDACWKYRRHRFDEE